MRTSFALIFALALGTVAVGCSSDDAAESSDDSTLAKLTSRFADLKKIKTDNLARVGAGFATSKLNDALSTGGTGVTFGAPVVFGVTDEVNAVVPDGGKVRGIDKIVTGLASKYGENELATAVNKVRLTHLQTTSDKYYVESTFDIGASVGHQWNYGAGGLGAGTSTISVGFNADAKLGSRVILASDSGGLSAVVKTPAAAAKATRGFVFPQSLDDVRKMKPGEMLGLRGLGHLGGNFGIGVPVLVASPAPGLGYSIVASAGIAGVLGGQLDVQMLRLEGDEVVIEVGIEEAQVSSWSAGIRDGWGVNGICDDGEACLKKLKVGPVEVDLQTLVEKAMVKRLNATFQSKLQASGSSGSGRVTVSRMRFHLDRGDRVEVGKALEQALKADVRYAQALYNRDLDVASPAVTVDFDLLRSTSTSTRDFGAALFGLDIFHRYVVEKQGEFVVQTPDATKVVLFDTLQKRSGWFQMDHGFKRTGISALTLDAKSPDKARGEANLFIQTVVGDSHMDDDILLDNADALIATLAGTQAFAPLDKFGNAMERALWKECPVQEVQDGRGGSERRTWDEKCNVALLDPARLVVEVDGSKISMVDAKARGLSGFKALVGALPLPDQHKALLQSAAELRLTLQSVGIHNLDAANGPNVSFALDYRLDNTALATIASKDADAYKRALTAYVAAVAVKRGETVVRPEASVSAAKWAGTIDGMTKVFVNDARTIGMLATTEQSLIPEALAGKRYVANPVGIRFTIDGGESAMYEKAIMTSLSQERSQAATRLFDDLYNAAKGLSGIDLYPEHAAAYPLLALVPADDLEVAMDVTADTSSSFWVSRERFQAAGFKPVTASARGPKVATISGGLFSLDALLAQP